MMSEQVVSQPTVTAPPPTRPKRSFSATESVFAWVCLVMGYLFCRVYPVTAHPLGGLLFVLMAFAVALTVLYRQGKRPGMLPLIAVGSAIVIAASLVLCANPFVHNLAYLYAAVVFAYLLYASGGNALEPGLSDLLLMDFFKALFVMPFYALGAVFSAAFTGRAKAGGTLLLKILLGLVLAVVPTAIVFGLLSYDRAFTEQIQWLIDSIDLDIFSHIGSVLLGIPVGMYLFGLYIASADRRCPGFTAEKCRSIARDLRIAPASVTVAAVLPVLILYVVFFISQMPYYLSGFVGQLPIGFSYAEYAREGFFQLCAVSVFNLLILTVVSGLMRRTGDKPPVLLRIFSVILSVFTLVLISTAVAKMGMYIDSYGLTHKRVYATWLMAVLAIVFVLVIVKQFVPRLKLIAVSVVVAVVCFAGLALSGVDSLIATYNVDRYLGGTLEEVDVGAMEDLGDAAVPEMVRLAQELDRQNGTDIRNPDPDLRYEASLYADVARYLYSVAAKRDQGLFNWTIPRAGADAALASAGIAENPEWLSGNA